MITSKLYSHPSLEIIPSDQVVTWQSQDKDLARLEWRNAIQESNESPDLVLSMDGRTIWIEVKATQSSGLSEPRFTLREVLHAKEKRADYWVALVCNVDGPTVTITLVEDPFVAIGLQNLIAIAEKTQDNAIQTNEISSIPDTYFCAVGRSGSSEAKARLFYSQPRQEIINHISATEYLSTTELFEPIFAEARKDLICKDLSVALKVHGGSWTTKAKAAEKAVHKALARAKRKLKHEGIG